MLKKLVPALALTGLAFGSGLCFNPYNHNYGFSTKNLNDSHLSSYNKIIVLHNGKMRLDKYMRIKLAKYTVKGNKALMLMDAGNGYEYFVMYTECINGKPITKDVEVIGEDLGAPSASVQAVNDPKYPMKFGFYKNGFWVKDLVISWIQHLNSFNGPGGYACDYETIHYPYKLINEHKTYDAPSKDQYLPNSVCNALTKS
jgi:hypothetical protein